MKQFVIAFDNQDQVYDALDATEDLGTRVIPLLPEIRESCGLALMGEIGAVEEAVGRLDREGLPYNGVYSYERENGKRKVEAL
ncbi:MAG: putative Se/S carrier-like protein [Peptoniphilus sp.]|nr:putative Se/S carrier-like protein [Peptoniphilus sp.]MDD7362606.1 DUF3343 domain-containing protein [Bacillota bacterium]MDY6044995.1 putative Se/S carrier-like protein [Peptoniphilus sp.]